jgi:hypothetical protein
MIPVSQYMAVALLNCQASIFLDCAGSISENRLFSFVLVLRKMPLIWLSKLAIETEIDVLP